MCSQNVPEHKINAHLDNDCQDELGLSSNKSTHRHSTSFQNYDSQKKVAPIFSQPFKTADSPNGTFALRGEKNQSSTGVSKKRKSDNLPQVPDTPLKRGKTVPSNLQSAAPLAEKLRPTSLEEFIGQNHLLGPGSLMSNMLNTGSTGSMIFWGPPGYVLTGRNCSAFLADMVRTPRLLAAVKQH